MKFAKALALAGLTTLGVTSALAQDIRFITPRGSQFFEVITGAPGGGRFITTSPYHLNNFYISGYTDRVSRGETIFTSIRGSGSARVQLTVNGRPVFNPITVNLPFSLPQRVSPSAFADNIVLTVWQGGRTVSRRVPIGTRP